MTALNSSNAAADLGISIVISGLFEDVFEVCRECGLVPHSVNMSLGTWGRTELLPEGEEFEMVTMCGHGVASRALVGHIAKRVGRGELGPEEAAVELARPCVCNIVNPTRAAALLRRAGACQSDCCAEGKAT